MSKKGQIGLGIGLGTGGVPGLAVVGWMGSTAATAIEGITAHVAGPLVTVRVASSFTPGTAYFHWWEDGIYVGVTRVPERTFIVEPGQQIRVSVQDTTDPGYDVVANAPTVLPRRRVLSWVRSTATDVASYEVLQQVDGGQFARIGTVPVVAGQWAYEFLTDVVPDLSAVVWAVRAVDEAGLQGATVATSSEAVVRSPDAPDYVISYAANRVTFTEVS